MIARIATLLVFLLSFLAQTVSAQNPARPSPPSIDASSYMLVDYHSEYVIAESNATEEVEPASLTKMMTAYVAGEEIDEGHIELHDEVLISEKAWRTGGSRMFVEVDTRVTVEDLLKGVIIQSGNDASVALAEHISGSEEVFAQLMNQTAATLGMSNTHFVNSTGMPAPGHITTAQDMAKLAAALIRDHPNLYAMHAVKDFTYNGIKQPNRNQLLWRDDSVDGIKTGHTENAGYCLVASAERQGMRLISVVMGASSMQARTSHTKSLLEYGFRFFETKRIAQGNHILGSAKIWKGAEEEINYGLAEDLYITVPRGEVDKIDQNLDLAQPLIAPLASGQKLGSLSINLDGETLVERPVIALGAVEQAGLFHRLIDGAKLMLE